MNSTKQGADPISDVMPQIADHVLIRRIGGGAYGDVWLAKNIIGGFRAAKVVYRKKFSDDRPYQREFEGIRKFEPISRTHPGFVTILQVGQNKEAGYFYYVMELADDVRADQGEIETDTYVPRTLQAEITNHPHRPLPASLQIAQSLTSALSHLHAQNLIHRDIKPSNIIFVNGEPKFADIGLITEVGEGVSVVGSIGFMPSEGPGEVTADIFSLGRVFYELFMGLPSKRFPELPGEAEEFTTVPELLQINNLILKACHHDPRQRFQSARELHKALRAVAGTVQERQTDTGTKETGPSQSSKSAADPRSKTVITTGGGGGRPVANVEPRPKALLSRRAVLFIGVPTAVVGAFLLGRRIPPGQEIPPEDLVKKFDKWEVLYDVLDDKLACFMGYIGAASPDTKFLIYSRGTDRKWVMPGFHKQWTGEIEARFPELKGRINAMIITTPPGRQRASFTHPETAEEMKKTIKLILGPTPTPSDSPDSRVIVLMDTTAERGIYDDENKREGITNAEVLKKQLQNFFNRMYPESISIESAKRDWQGEQRVLGHHPSLVIIHRSAFFHPVNAKVGLGYPVQDPQGKLIGWEQ